MNRGLIVVDDSETHRTLLADAGTYAVGANAELVLFSHLNSDEFESNMGTIETIGHEERTSYDSEVALQPAEQLAISLARETIADLDVDYEVVTHVVDKTELADEILAAAEENRCDHIFLVGRHRSPTGKAFFGDATQQVILNFDGRVTVDIDDSV